MKKLYIKYIILLFLLISSFLVFPQSGFRNIENESSVIISNQQTQNNVDVSVTSFPNPASKTITFTIKGGDITLVEIEIFKLTGFPVYSFKPEVSQYELDVALWEEGIYFYKVLYNGKVVKTEKFVVLKK